MRPWGLVADCCNTLLCCDKGTEHITHDGMQINEDLHKIGGKLVLVVSPFTGPEPICMAFAAWACSTHCVMLACRSSGTCTGLAATWCSWCSPSRTVTSRVRRCGIGTSGGPWWVLPVRASHNSFLSERLGAALGCCMVRNMWPVAHAP